jgi:hypothetical protein
MSRDARKLLEELVTRPGGHTRDPTALHVAVSLLTSIISCGADVRAAAVDLCSVADSMPTPGERCAVLVHVMSCARNHQARRHVVDTLINSVAEAFLRCPVPELLVAGGLAATDASEFMQGIRDTQRQDIRRSKVVRMLQSLCVS